MTLRGAAITMTFFGETPDPAAGVGHDYGISTAAPHELILTPEAAAATLAKEQAATATGYVTYFRRK